MKETIFYAYHLQLDHIEEYKEYSLFEVNQKKYYFTKIKRSSKEINDLIQVIDELLKKGIPVFSFIRNVDGNFITKVNEIDYILVEVTDSNHIYSMEDMIERNKKLLLTHHKSELFRNDWGTLWSQKVEHFEYQVFELGKKYPLIVNSFSYFNGLAENAICYVKMIERKYSKTPKMGLCHKRITYPNYRLNYDNPLNFVFDLEVRDVAEYLKSMCISDSKGALEDLELYLKISHLDAYNASYLYARLIYPSYYFDIHEGIVDRDEGEEKLLHIIDSIPVIEDFFKKSYLVISKYVFIEPIDWLNKTL